MVQNSQRPEPRNSGNPVDGTAVEVHSVFHTIQGEGPFSGSPAVFVRLAGCNMQCPGCDTLYTDGRLLRDVPDIVAQVRDLAGANTDLVVITGGEPLRQNLTPLMWALQEASFYIQIETNGTLPPSPQMPPCAVVCSPKAGKVNTELKKFGILAYKYVLEATAVNAEDGLPTTILGANISPARPPDDWGGVIYLSPMDSQEAKVNTDNTRAVVESCLRYGYTLNLQIHKLVGLQ